MRFTARPLTGTALAVLCLGALAVPSAYAGDHESLEVSPATASPGTTVTVSTRACGPKGHGVGDAQSLGAGDFKLRPGSHKELAVGRFKVPDHAKPGTYAIGVACDNGKTASGDLTVAKHHGGGHQPTREPERDWGHDQGRDQEHDGPRGHVKTGVGGSVGPDTTRIAAGVALLAAAAGGGVWLLRRRTTGG
ncbi:hypothetical protein I3F58_13945 [Streptomyces sp. MUM 203J]|uniref:hypothetical protein n=1 Tax=Streptomyces sp. MUM 203J TaxID=2791990 RepID=UPI001F04924B|nr:hypothetical protein [Streptomyces sp. MUM 203J]MCH0540654.1 hypothetical protein [Streptomyces sp. MUM 203J]